MIRKILAITVLSALCLTVSGQNTYYVSADGDDNASGLSPACAWKTLRRVNGARLAPGDKVLFRCGDVFRGALKAASGKPSDPVFYGSFGVGEKPVLEPSHDASSPSRWEAAGKRLWRCVQPSSDELGNVILNNGEAGCAVRVDRTDLLKKDLHFCWVKEEQAVYLKSRMNPGLRFRSIELAEKQHVIDEAGCHDVVYDGLWLRYGAAHGIGGGGVKRVTVRNCDVSWIGGSALYHDNDGRGIRYGNGIEFWGSAEDVLVEHCRIWECWDAGLTNQSSEKGSLQRNVTYRGNEVWNCEYSYEYWQQGDGARTVNIRFEDNICRDAGKGWGHVQRWNPNASHLMFYDSTAETDGFIIRGNRFGHAEDCGMRLFNAWYRSITMEDNEWSVRDRTLCRYHARPTEGLVHKYPDYLDQTHRDSRREIESQTVEKPLVLRGRKALRHFNEKFGFEKQYLNY